MPILPMGRAEMENGGRLVCTLVVMCPDDHNAMFISGSGGFYLPPNLAPGAAQALPTERKQDQNDQPHGTFLCSPFFLCSLSREASEGRGV